jgi:hypothetical protein
MQKRREIDPDRGEHTHPFFPSSRAIHATFSTDPLGLELSAETGPR